MADRIERGTIYKIRGRMNKRLRTSKEKSEAQQSSKTEYF
jgi:hypothetical protein